MKMSKEEFLSLSGIEHQTLGVWIAQEWLKPSGSSVEPSFTDIDIARARLIRELFVDFFWREHRRSGSNSEFGGPALWRAQDTHGITSSSSHYARGTGLRLRIHVSAIPLPYPLPRQQRSFGARHNSHWSCIHGTPNNRTVIEYLIATALARFCADRSRGHTCRDGAIIFASSAASSFKSFSRLASLLSVCAPRSLLKISIFCW